jgi:hypothetical protein
VNLPYCPGRRDPEAFTGADVMAGGLDILTQVDQHPADRASLEDS